MIAGPRADVGPSQKTKQSASALFAGGNLTPSSILRHLARRIWNRRARFRERTMRKIVIVGGGQSGLQLGLGLLQNNYEVTIVSNRTPEQILSGRVTSSQFMFHDSLQNERDLGINFWEKECPITEGIAFTIPGPEKTKALFWEAKLDGYGQSIDQRVKFAGWMKEFAKRGGNLVIKDAGPQDVDGYAKSHDLALVAAGKGEINRMFERDAEKSPFDQPMRALALTYVKNMVPRKPFTAV